MERIEALAARRQADHRRADAASSTSIDLTSGFQPSDLVIVAARPSMGKTAFVLNIAQHAAIEHRRAGRASSRSK